MENKTKKNSYKIVTILVVSIILGMFSIVHAVDNSQIYLVPYNYSPPTSVTKGLFVGDYSDNTNIYEYYVSKRYSDVYPAYVTTYIANDNKLHFIFISDGNEITDEIFQISTNTIIISSGQESFSANTYGNTRYSSIKDGHAYTDVTTNLVMNVDISQYNNFDDAFNSVVNYQESSPAYSLNYSIPAGNVIFIELPNDNVENNFTASTSSAVDHSNPWTTSNQKYGLLDSIPYIVNANISGTSNFTWYGIGSNSVFGTYKTWRSTHDIRTGKYLCIINPSYPSDTPENQALNGAINITVERAISFKVYQLNAGWTEGSIDNTATGVIYDGTYDENTSQWSTVDQNGNSSSPVSGGSNAGFSTDGITVTQWLENIAHQISGFFTGAIGAINTLISAIGNIATELHGLYVWLPPAVQGILTSALILAITIGVIKVFI